MSKKIGILGNNNNNNFALARYLRDNNIDCDLLLFDHEVDHFHPSCDTYSEENLTWIRKLSWGSQKNFLRTPSKIIQNDIGKYDYLLGCGSAAAYSRKINRRVNIYIPYGGDIWTETFYRMTRPSGIISTQAAVYAQRLGLKDVDILHSPLTTELYEYQFNKYFFNAKRWFDPVPMIYANEYSGESMIINKINEDIKRRITQIRKDNQFVVTAHGRHVWGDKSKPSSKGNKLLLDGWKRFCDLNPSVKKKLILMEYGADVEKSRRYIKALGVEHSVEWFPLLKRKEIMQIIVESDLIAGEFLHSWVTGGVINEALVAAKPLLMYRSSQDNLNANIDLFEIYNANTVEGISERLSECFNDDEGAKKMGALGKLWYTNNVKNVINKYLYILK